MIYWLWLIPVALFFEAAGYWLGRRHEAAYWAMHDGGTPVHHKGKFYYVGNEQIYDLKTKVTLPIEMPVGTTEKIEPSQLVGYVGRMSKSNQGF